MKFNKVIQLKLKFKILLTNLDLTVTYKYHYVQQKGANSENFDLKILSVSIHNYEKQLIIKSHWFVNIKILWNTQNYNFQTISIWWPMFSLNAVSNHLNIESKKFKLSGLSLNPEIKNKDLWS